MRDPTALGRDFFLGGFFGVENTMHPACAGKNHGKVRQGVKNYFFKSILLLIFDQKSGQKWSKNWPERPFRPFNYKNIQKNKIKHKYARGFNKKKAIRPF